MYAVTVRTTEHVDRGQEFFRVLVEGLHPDVPVIEADAFVPTKEIEVNLADGVRKISVTAQRKLVKDVLRIIAENYTYYLKRAADRRDTKVALNTADWYWRKSSIRPPAQALTRAAAAGLYGQQYGAASENIAAQQNMLNDWHKAAPFLPDMPARKGEADDFEPR